MRHDDQRNLFALIQFDEQVGYVLRGVLIQRTCRLVGEEQAGPIYQGPHNRHSLSLASGQLAGSMEQML